ncbi:MAG: Flp pilus assembly complex ATPase component TadA, partial [Peptococcaceae bacterium]|nr:Flp pilus assembly complex ATPase component TadA [Peptococcaceae bacterium]
ALEDKEIVSRVRKALVEKYGEALLKSNGGMEDLIRTEVRACLGHGDPGIEDYVISRIAGLGPADVLFRDPEVSEVMINGPYDIYVERRGVIEKTGLRYENSEEVINVLHRIVQRCGRKVNFSSPLVDARLPDGSRVNAVIPPSSPYPVITIRRFVKKKFTTGELLGSGFFSEEMAEFFRAAVEGRANIVIAGAAGSGKTTLMRWLCSFIPPGERVLTVEDTRELALDRDHVVQLEAGEKAGVYELMVNALRMRPDRIIMGEVRGAEAFELLQAMGTGHEGSLTSVHTNYGRMEAIHRLVRAAIKAGGVTAEELQSMIAEIVDILVFVKRFRDGSRKIVHVSQVLSEGGRPVFRDIYRYRFSEGGHVFCRPVDGDLAERLRENLMGCLPEIRAFGGDGGD